MTPQPQESWLTWSSVIHMHSLTMELRSESGPTKHANLVRYYPTYWRSEDCFPAFSLNSRKLHHYLPLPLTCMMLLAEAALPTKLANATNPFVIAETSDPRA